MAGKQVTLPVKSVQSAVFSLPPSFLSPGENYTFQVTARVSKYPELYTALNVSIIGEYSPLQMRYFINADNVRI
jgi:hypothetical protein